ncbi:hypothetical protein TCON_0864 [Astathelohania contejeani]|uniref:Uncharacterized protein n=1 Tax=Astathelohania contejeani TaxID=164912 RepID=A0ABQ7I0G6_9MICR|nr:hypothetical protein TCON_0864 [Thelohania contejeani]
MKMFEIKRKGKILFSKKCLLNLKDEPNIKNVEISDVIKEELNECVTKRKDEIKQYQLNLGPTRYKKCHCCNLLYDNLSEEDLLFHKEIKALKIPKGKLISPNIFLVSNQNLKRKMGHDNVNSNLFIYGKRNIVEGMLLFVQDIPNEIVLMCEDQEIEKKLMEAVRKYLKIKSSYYENIVVKRMFKRVSCK